jgi:hypothetical protein
MPSAPAAGPFAPVSGQVRTFDRRPRNCRQRADIHDPPGQVSLKNAALGQHRHARSAAALNRLDQRKVHDDHDG